MTLLEKAAIAHKEAVAIKEQYTEGIGVHHPATRLREMACMIEVLAGLVEAMGKFGLNEGMILTFNQEDELKEAGKKIKVKPVWQWSSTRSADRFAGRGELASVI